MPYDIIIGRNKSDKKKFSDKGLIYLGKGYVQMGNYTSLSNKIWLDVVRSHVILVSGKRGSGKSYSLGVIAEELSDLPEEIRQNIAPIIFDTMGIFWTMKYKNEKELILLEEWGLKPRNLPVNIWIPYGYFEEFEKRGVPADKKFALAVSELEIEDWLSIFDLRIIEPISVLIQRTISKLKKQENFDLNDIINEINEDKNIDEKIKESSIALFKAAKAWKIFAEKEQESTKVSDLIQAGKTTILDLSVYPSTSIFNIRALIIGIISKKIFEERMLARKKEEIESIQYGIDYNYNEKKELPLIWIFIDECLNGETEIITDNAHTPLKEIVKRFENGEKFKVLGFDKENNNYDYFNVLDVYKKGKRKVIKITTETGREIICTPEHRLLTENNIFASAFSLDKIAIPLFQHYSANKKIIEYKILGHLFGDGWVSDKTKSLGFSGKGNKKDLEKIKEDLLKLGYKSTNIYERNTTSKINHKGKINIVKGVSQSFQSTSAYNYFRKLAGFSGEKTLSPIKIPEVIINASDLEKAEFLAALMGSDGQIISKAKNAKGDFNAIRFSFNKIESLEKEAFQFAEQIKRMFEDLGIKVSLISKKEGNLRKDGNKTIKVIITLEKNIENTIRFLEKIGYRYCSKKESEGLKWLEYLKARLFLKNERHKIKQKALELHSIGFGKLRISKQLNFPEAQIRDWIYSKMSPGLPKTFLDFEDWINNRKKGNIIFERIFRIEENGEEEVYDISIDKVHNFISNNIISHNCHEFLPMNRKTPATNSLIQLIREGRQPGISMVLATQQPGVIHRDVMTQSDIVLSHKLTNKKDMEALNEIMQSYFIESIQKSMNSLPDAKGSALILDDNSERLYPIKIRPRFTWHGGETPTAIKGKSEY